MRLFGAKLAGLAGWLVALVPAQADLGEVLVLGPLPAPAAVFGKPVDTGSPGVRKLEPLAGAKVSWMGREYTWRRAACGAGGLVELPAGQVGRIVYLATNLLSKRWQRYTFTVQAKGRATLFIDGKKAAAGSGKVVAKGRALTRGHFPLLLKSNAPEKGAWSVGLTVTWGGVAKPVAPEFTLESAHAPARFREVWKRRGVGNLTISPEGKRVLFTKGEELQVRALPGGDVVRRLRVGRIGSLSFRAPDRVVFLRQGALVALDLNTGAEEELVKGLKKPGNIRWTADGKRVFWLESPAKPARKKVDRRTTLRESMKDWNPGCTIWCADVAVGMSRRITAGGDFHVTSFDLSPDGSRLLLVRKEPIAKRPWFTSALFTVDTTTLAAKRVLTLQTGFESWPGDLRWSPDGKRVLFVAPPAQIFHPDDTRASKPEDPKTASPETKESQGEHNYHNADLYVLDPATGALDRVTASFDPGVASHTGTAPWWSPDGKRIHFLALTGRRNAFYTVDRSEEKPRFSSWAAGSQVTRGVCAALAAPTPTVAFQGGSFTRMPFVCTLAADAPAATEVFDPNAKLRKSWKLVQPVDFAFIGKSGLRIDGWLYKPLGGSVDPASTPLIVYYYAGATATRESCYWTHQYLCANGYAVYVINPRGGGEYGRRFADSHVNDWGARASLDVIAGVKELLRTHPELDPRRVGCWGGSYGGFTTMDLLTKTEMFAVAVSLYGISNIASYWGGGTWGWTYGDMAMARSFPWNNRELFVDRSPLFKADRIKTPLLLLHGLADVNVPAVESDQMFTALKVLGRTVEYVAFAGEDHGISGSMESRSEHRIMMLEWFDRFLKKQPEAWRARWKK